MQMHGASHRTALAFGTHLTHAVLMATSSKEEKQHARRVEVFRRLCAASAVYAIVPRTVPTACVSKHAEECSFWFVRATKVKAYTQQHLPLLHQDLLRAHPDWFVRRSLSLVDVCGGGTTALETWLTVSHRWMLPGLPDPDGAQLAAIRAFLAEHPEVELVWYDAWCLPQGVRTEAEASSFRTMLAHVNWLYASTTVLLLVDLSYISRFWTQLEAWLAVQVATPHGLRSDPRAPRMHAVPLYNATRALIACVYEMWASRTPWQVVHVLGHPDVTVTNASDKDQQLTRLLALDDRVRNAWSA